MVQDDGLTAYVGSLFQDKKCLENVSCFFSCSSRDPRIASIKNHTTFSGTPHHKK